MNNPTSSRHRFLPDDPLAEGGTICRENPGYRESYLHFLREDYPAAIESLTELCRRNKDQGPYLNDLGICYVLAGSREQANQVLRRAAILSGEDSAAHMNLLYLSDSVLLPALDQEFPKNRYAMPEGKPDYAREFLSIIVLEYNNPQLTLDCLHSIRSCVDSVPHEVVLVDNSDRGPPLAFYRSSGVKNLVYHKSAKNLGFSAGCNQGARLAKGEFLYFVNNDTLFKKNSTEELLKVLLLDRRVGAVGSKLLYEDGTIQHAGVVFDFLTGRPKHRYRFGISDNPAANIPMELQAVTGASLMTRRALFEQIGGFSEEYFNGFEDVEFCLKVGSGGYKIVYNPRSVLQHFESRSKNRFTNEPANMALYRKRCARLARIDELDCLSFKEQFVISFTEDRRKKERQIRLFRLVNHLCQDHPKILKRIPLRFIERAKNRRFQKVCTRLFNDLAEQASRDEARVIYRYFLRRDWFRLSYIRHMRSTLSLPNRHRKGEPSNNRE